MKWIHVSVDEHIGVIRLNREEAANSLSQALLSEFFTQLKNWEHDRFIRAIIITGSGKKVFCAGADLKERSRMTEIEVRQAVQNIRETFNLVAKMPQPVIAAINGAAIGGGLELALACDLRIASKQATFALTETSLGIIPGAGGTQRLPRLIGIERAKRMIFTGEKIAVEKAMEWGLISYYVDEHHLFTEAKQLAQQIVKNAPIAIQQAKFAIDRGMEVDLNTGISIEKKAYEVTIPTKDRLEGLQAFKEKRLPKYIGE